jgi:tRNA (uracil-5-)-methyltransferase TRM9
MKRLKDAVCCPLCKSKLTLIEDTSGQSLKCTGDNCRSVYPVSCGIPVLLPYISDEQYRTQMGRQEDSQLREAFKNLLPEEKKRRKNLGILEKLSIFKHEKYLKVIDLGSGLGHTLKHLAGHFYDFYGLELDVERILVSQEKERIVCADMKYIPFSDGFFDIVLCIGVIHHLSNVDDYLLLIREIKRVLKKNAFFMFWEPKPIFYRGIAEKFVFSRIGNLFNYTRNVRIILKKEAKEYYYWLSHYNDFFIMLKQNGFIVERRKIGIFKDCWIMRLA